MRTAFSPGLPLSVVALLVACGSPAGPGGATLEVPVLSIEPGNSVVEGGTSLKLTASVRGEDGVASLPTDVTWFSSDQAVASVERGGTVRARQSGQATILANWQGATAIAKVTVTSPGGAKEDPPACLVIPKDGGKC